MSCGGYIEVDGRTAILASEEAHGSRHYRLAASALFPFYCMAAYLMFLFFAV